MAEDKGGYGRYAAFRLRRNRIRNTKTTKDTTDTEIERAPLDPVSRACTPGNPFVSFVLESKDSGLAAKPTAPDPRSSAMGLLPASPASGMAGDPSPARGEGNGSARNFALAGGLRARRVGRPVCSG
jgi:hypothetical protein